MTVDKVDDVSKAADAQAFLKLKELQSSYRDLCGILCQMTPPGRERELAKLSLERSMVWASLAMAAATVRQNSS